MKKKGGNLKTSNQLQGFCDAVDFCAFQDMGFEGYPFTWSNGRDNEANIQLRLDRSFATESLLLQFPFYKVIHARRYNSDHCPLFVELDIVHLRASQRKKNFKFEECWIREPEYAERIKGA